MFQICYPFNLRILAVWVPSGDTATLSGLAVSICTSTVDCFEFAWSSEFPVFSNNKKAPAALATGAWCLIEGS